MRLDASDFPLVWMRDSASAANGTDDDVFKAFEALFRRRRTFVLLGEDGFKDHRHSHDEKKRVSLWMKSHRSELKLVKAMIVVEPSTAKRLAAKAFTVMFTKFWGYPLLWASSPQDGIETATKLLAKQPAEGLLLGRPL